MKKSEPFIWKHRENLFRIYPQSADHLEKCDPPFLLDHLSFRERNPHSLETVNKTESYMSADPNMFDGPAIGSVLPVSHWLDRIISSLPICIQMGTYFDYLASDIFKSTVFEPTDSRNEEPDENSQFRSIGVTGLVLTSDLRLVTVQQLGANDKVTGATGPAGSGSLEPEDLRDTDSFRSALITGSHREIWQEAGIKESELSSTVILGVAEWREKGYKPEVFTLSRYRGEASDIASSPDRDESESLFSGHVSSVRVNAPSVWNRHNIYSVAPSLSDDVLTIPFELALLLLASQPNRIGNV